MSNELAIADDFLCQVADQAERRIDAVIKIKRTALKVTNPRDWTDQNGNPYLQVSGSEKIANLFNISWQIGEPQYEEEPSGHFTYSYKGIFILGGRSIEVEGTRSSKDTFFQKNDYSKPEVNGKFQKLPVSEIDKGDVKKAALTNLLGNGITRILGIRNLTWADLKEFSGIDQTEVAGKVTYRKTERNPIAPPQETAKAETTTSEFISDAQSKRFYAIAKGKGWKDEDLKKWLIENFEIDSTKRIKKTQYENIVLEIEAIEAPHA